MSNQIEIKKLDSKLQGIGYLNDKIVFVSKTIPGEVCIGSVIKEHKNYQNAVVEKILKPSEKRVIPKCPYFGRCGGCDLQHIDYSESILWKEKMLEELFQRNNLWHDSISVVPSKNAYHYRNKVSLKVMNGKIGFYSFETHQLVEIEECIIAKDAINAVIQDFSLFSFLNGELIIRVNENDEILMDIITEEEINIDKKLVARHKIVGIYHNHRCVYGEPFLFFRKNGVLYKVSMDSFFQVNDSVSDELFLLVRNGLKNARNVLDLYCGVGAIGLQVAKEGVSITGIEVVKSAILNAIYNARLNHIESSSFHLGKVEEIISKLEESFDVIIVDPPRTGLDSKTKEIILKIRPEKVIYVSCNPITLVRDLKEMEKFYVINIVKAFDMFPYTRHVECVCVLNKK